MNIPNVKEINEFKQNGFIVIKNVINSDQINDIKSALYRILEFVCDKKGVSYTKGSLDSVYLGLKKQFPVLKSHAYDLFSTLPILFQVLNQERIVNLMKDLLGTSEIFFNGQQIKLDDASQDRLIPPHQELGQLSFNGHTIWIPLQDVNEETGGMQFIPGSHKNGYLPTKHSSSNSYLGVEDRFYQDKDFVAGYCSAGDAIVFTNKLIHASLPSKVDKIRYTCIGRYNDFSKTPYLMDEKTQLNMPQDFKAYEAYQNQS